MINIDSIQSLTDFKRNTNESVEKLRRTGRPIVLTVNGRAELVVLDAKAFQDIVDQMEFTDSETTPIFTIVAYSIKIGTLKDQVYQMTSTNTAGWDFPMVHP